MVITSGGNAPAVGRCAIDIALQASERNCEVIGARYAATHLMERRLGADEISDYFDSDRPFHHALSKYFVKISPTLVRDEEMYERSGTFLGSSTSGVASTPEQLAILKDNINALGVEGIVVIGGDGSMRIFAGQVEQMGLDIPILFAGKTIDNDLPNIDFSLGFWSAVEHNSLEIKNLMTTAADHKGIFIMEIMGRNCPELALHSALGAYDKNGNPYVDMVLGVDPQKNYDLDTIAEVLRSRHDRIAPVSGLGPYAVILVAECMLDVEGHSLEQGSKSDKTYVAGHPAHYLENLLRTKMPADVLLPYTNGIRVNQPGHLQRAAPICQRDADLSANIARNLIAAFERGASHQVIVNSDNGFRLMPLDEFVAADHVFDAGGYARAMAHEKMISFGNEGANFWQQWQRQHPHKLLTTSRTLQPV
jgi:6-phosphofructokinase